MCSHKLNLQAKVSDLLSLVSDPVSGGSYLQCLRSDLLGLRSGTVILGVDLVILNSLRADLRVLCSP